MIEGRSMLRPYNIVRILGRHDSTLAPAGGAAFVQDDVDREAVEPRAERAFAPEGAQLVPEPHEDVLGALFGVTPIAGETETECVNTAGVLTIELPKCGLVAGLGSGDKIRRGGRGRHGTKTPAGAATFEGGSRQPLLELFLHLIQARPLLRDLGLRLVLYVVHARAYRAHLVVDQGVHAVPQLLFRRGDLLAEHRAQARCDRLIEIRPHGEVRMMQRPGQT